LHHLPGKKIKKLAFTVYINNNFFHGQSCPRRKGAMRLTLGEAPSYERPHHNTAWELRALFFEINVWVL